MAKEIEEKDEEEVLEGVYAGAITLTSLPKGLFDKIVALLRERLHLGYGEPNEFPDGSGRKQLLNKLDNNVRVFSAAKTFQQVKEMSAQVTDEFGNKRPFREFEGKAREIFDRYNRQWLKSEQDTAYTQSQQAKKWKEIEANKDLFPYLEYRTAGDDRVRDEHEDLDGIIRHADDSFWDVHMPANGWRCRCEVRQRRSAPGGESDVRGVPEPPPLFKMNPGKDGMLFKEDVGDGLEHPYFKVEERYEPLKDQGFGLT